VSRWIRIVALVPGVAAGLLGLSACGGTDRLDPDALARVLPAQVLPDHPELLIEPVCPERIDKRAGTTVVCTASLAGAPVEVRVVQLDDRGAVRAELDRPVLDVVKSARFLAERFSKDLDITTTVECEGPAVRVLVVGETLRCVARDPSLRSRVLVVTVLDETGGLDAKLE
jgi:hypothetical protein